MTADNKFMRLGLFTASAMLLFTNHNNGDVIRMCKFHKFFIVITNFNNCCDFIPVIFMPVLIINRENEDLKKKSTKQFQFLTPEPNKLGQTREQENGDVYS